MIYKDNKGQGAIEFLFLISFGLILVLSLANFLSYDNDLNLAIAGARNGINLGASEDRIAIYEESAYGKYSNNNSVLTHPNAIKIVKIETVNRGYDSRYNRTSIQLRVFASSPTIVKNEDKVSAGDRITYNVRKSITMTFNTSKLTNNLYNPCFSKHHVFTTSNVQWV
ncbi:hypothetical protein KQY27_08030 [Methanobrevibacter sp. TMH8]|uniref:hypothetical protein n=1 Tax=Methanobrevibacter sp. TMH8 TaxID=2848611 RepID=UPI001CCF0FA7|nr:hypothetical protein [Methanobrevibacter sp. TMH8]MBZ9571494.1 hypothetical protein [Methanobrevibacter sp. TMH8]